MLVSRKYINYLTLAGIIFLLAFSYNYKIVKDYFGDDNLQIKPVHLFPDNYTQFVRSNINAFKSLRLPVNSTVARPFVRTKSIYRVAPRYGLSSCIVEKAMCTLLQSIFCYLYDSDGFIKTNRTIPTEFWQGRFCENRNEFLSTQEKRLTFPFLVATIFMARHPVERFLSGFIDKCVNQGAGCYGCSRDILCTVEEFHKAAMKINQVYYDTSVPIASHIPDQAHETLHFEPANWMCDLHDEADRYYFVKYGETKEDLAQMYQKLEEIFRAHGVEETKIKYIMGSITKRTKHATKTSNQGSREEYLKKLKASPAHLKMLNSIYFYDTQIFGFTPL